MIYIRVRGLGPERLIVSAVCAGGADRKEKLLLSPLSPLSPLSSRLRRGFGWGAWLWLGLAWLGLWIPTVDRGNRLKIMIL